MKTNLRYLILGTLAFSCLAIAQDQQSGGWRRLGESNPYPANGVSQNSAPQNSAPQNPPPAQAPVPPSLTIKPGTYVTVRINQPLSSDRNQAGDAFSATLVKPVVVDGYVVAQTGQTLGGHVVE